MKTSRCREIGTTQNHEDEAPTFGMLPDLVLCISSSGCSSILFIISFITKISQ
jgi:hypothetical protein